jgi:hypothetical protein
MGNIIIIPVLIIDISKVMHFYTGNPLLENYYSNYYYFYYYYYYYICYPISVTINFAKDTISFIIINIINYLNKVIMLFIIIIIIKD